MNAVHTPSPINIAVAGASGRMGQTLIQAILANGRYRLSGAFAPPGNPLIGEDAGARMGLRSDVIIVDNAREGLRDASVLIDFTRPEATLAHLEVADAMGIRSVVGTTGFDDAQKSRLQAFAARNAMVFSPNMSVGVNVTFKLLELAARALSSGYDIEVIEAHHRDKVDAPSGTALKMGEILAQALGRDLKRCAVYERHGHVGEREPSSIGFSSIRGGDIVGDHTVLFAGTGERIEISHKSGSRLGYAEGSLRAVDFLSRQSSGMFDMSDVLGLR